MLRRITDLFVSGASQYSDDQIRVFDDVISCLAAEIELSARVLLAICLAPIPNAPPKIIHELAFDDAIEVAGPVLRQSERLDNSMLVENAKQKAQTHLLAISQRRRLSEVVTDVLLERGNEHVVLSVARNNGAKFSDGGFTILFQRSESDDRLATSFGSRVDIPKVLFLKLLAKASQSVRMKLEAAHPHLRREVEGAVAEATRRVRDGKLDELLDYNSAQLLVEELAQSGRLDEVRIAAFAQAGRLAETTAALALKCEVPLALVERAMLQERAETVLVLAKVIGLSWSALKAILLLRAGKRSVSPAALEQCLASYEQLNATTANEIVQFYRMRSQTRAHKYVKPAALATR